MLIQNPLSLRALGSRSWLGCQWCRFHLTSSL